jgi:hypothetical protein
LQEMVFPTPFTHGSIECYALDFPRFLRIESPRISTRWALLTS